MLQELEQSHKGLGLKLDGKFFFNGVPSSIWAASHKVVQSYSAVVPYIVCAYVCTACEHGYTQSVHGYAQLYTLHGLCAIEPAPKVTWHKPFPSTCNFFGEVAILFSLFPELGAQNHTRYGDCCLELRSKIFLKNDRHSSSLEKLWV